MALGADQHPCTSGIATSPTATTRRDFDRIALALDAAAAPDALRPPERALLAYVPAGARVLEVGCGHGALTREVARRAGSVLALDLSPEMVRVAQGRSAAHANIEYRVADVTAADLPASAFELVLSVATLHHLPLAPTLARLAGAVRPGGLLVVQDLVSRPGLRHLPRNALGWLARRLRAGAREPGAVVAALYRDHGRGERYLTPAEAAQAYAEMLPGACVTQHLEWRYTAVWRRASAA